MRACLLVVMALLGCKEKASSGPSDRASSSGPHMSAAEQQYIAKSVADLEAGLAARDEGAVLVNCIGTDAPGMPEALAAKVQRLCYVEAPTMFLEKAVASVKEGIARSPDLADLACMQLIVEDALKTLAAHPTTDAKLQGLVDEYARLCPAETAKLRAKLTGR